MARRYLFLLIINIAIGTFSAILILGEDVFWKLQFVDQFYTNYGTTPGDLFTLVFVAEFVIIWGIGSWWAVGLTDMLWEWISRL